MRAGRAAVRVLVAAGWLAAIAGLIALGTWQVYRRAWKLDLIARVDARIHASPVLAPSTADPDDAYRRVTVTGYFLPHRDSFVQAVTDLGAGWWVLTPLRSSAGRVVLINRGFLPDRRIAPTSPGPVTITGLLRLNEPGGAFLRHNDPAGDHWFSRDVVAIAARRGLGPVAPYFIDADRGAVAPGVPVGGLTVVSFTNNHLVYAITWYTLAIMGAAGFIYWIRLIRRGDEPAT